VVTSATTFLKRQKFDVESTGHLSAEGDLKAALLMIERLPLSDKQKAEAVRRLLALHGVRRLEIGVQNGPTSGS
jgi:hypothetical protein